MIRCCVQFGASGTQFPQLQSGHGIPGPEPVGKYSPGDLSPFGVADMLGNVWQYTDEFQDNHTRSVCVRGGSNYRCGNFDLFIRTILFLSISRTSFRSTPPRTRRVLRSTWCPC